MRPPERASAANALTLLHAGEVELKGRMPWSSNATFLVELGMGGERSLAVYKPGRGEQPLWDFGPGLFRREVAAYLLSEHLGWGIVPETVIRHDAPLGTGSLQRFVPADFEQHYFTLLEQPQHQAALRRIATFDLLANNADRKSGHCLLGEDGRIWAIDHGLCFHEDPKLRTVMWDFAGEQVPTELRDSIARVAASDLGPIFADVLDPDEIEALRQRAVRVLDNPRFPQPRSSRAYPWPLV